MRRLYKIEIHILQFITALLVFTGCVNDEINSDGRDGSSVSISFTVNMPLFSECEATRVAIPDENALSSLKLLIFDENRIFIKSVQVTLTPLTPGSAKGNAYITESNLRRIVHFVANYSFATDFDTQMAGKSEKEVFLLMSGTGFYSWARVDLPGGLHASDFITGSAKDLSLIRNIAKISVANNATSTLFDVSYTFVGEPLLSTVAPLDPVANSFTIGKITEATGVTYSNPTEVSAQWKTLAEPLYIFERSNKNDASYGYVIIKGRYPLATSPYTYFKISIANSLKMRYEIERNYSYLLQINRVEKDGFASFDLAKAAAIPSNFLTFSSEWDKVPLVSYEGAQLKVDRTSFFDVETSTSTWTFYANYYPNYKTAPTVTDNSNMSIAIVEETPSDPVFAVVPPYTTSTGALLATFNPTPATGERRAKIIVGKGGLVRSINVVQRPPFSLNPVTITAAGLDEGRVPMVQGSNVTLKFNIPSDYPSTRFPVTCYITTSNLTSLSNLRVDPIAGGKIRYSYIATAPGEQTVNFKTNKNYSAETINLDMLLCTGVSKSYINPVHNTTGVMQYSSMSSVTTPEGYVSQTTGRKFRAYVGALSDGKICLATFTPGTGAYTLSIPQDGNVPAASDNRVVTLEFYITSGTVYYYIYRTTRTVAQLNANGNVLLPYINYIYSANPPW